MDKKETLQLIESQLKSGVITDADLKQVLGDYNATHGHYAQKPENSKNVVRIIYIVGAVIILLGAIILVGENWSEIGFVGRILATLGLGLASFISALLLRKPEQNGISQTFYVISAVLMPLGTHVLLSQGLIDFTSMIQSIVALFFLAVFGMTFYKTRKNTVFLISIAYATWLYFALIAHVINSSLLPDDLAHEWSSMILGLAYICVGIGYEKVNGLIRESRISSRVLYAIGTLAILIPGLIIGGSFDIVYAIILCLVFYGSIRLRSRAMLIFGSVFFAGYVIRISSVYFADSIGWPLALILVGFLVIAAGYGAYYGNKMLKEKAPRS